MKNVKFSKEGTKLLISVDLSVSGETSKSGKSKVLATTEGNICIDEASKTYLGLNVYTTK